MPLKYRDPHVCSLFECDEFTPQTKPTASGVWYKEFCSKAHEIAGREDAKRGGLPERCSQCGSIPRGQGHRLRDGLCCSCSAARRAKRLVVEASVKAVRDAVQMFEAATRKRHHQIDREYSRRCRRCTECRVVRPRSEMVVYDRESAWLCSEHCKFVLMRRYWRSHAKRAQKTRRDKVHKPWNKKVRYLLWKRDHEQCYLCGRHVTLREMVLDHVRPVRHGGSYEIANLAVTHRSCNCLKASVWPLPEWIEGALATRLSWWKDLGDQGTTQRAKHGLRRANRSAAA